MLIFVLLNKLYTTLTHYNTIAAAAGFLTFFHLCLKAYGFGQFFRFYSYLKTYY